VSERFSPTSLPWSLGRLPSSPHPSGAASRPALPALLLQSAEAIALLDDQGRFLDLNEATCDLFGLPRDRLLGCALADLTCIGFDVATLPLPRTSGQDVIGELLIFCPQGVWQEIRYRVTPQADEPGHLIQFQPIQPGQATLAAELRRHRQGMALGMELTQKIQQVVSLADILDAAVAGLRRILQADRVMVYQILPDGSGKAISEARLPHFPVLMHQTFSEEVFPDSAQRLYAGGRVRAIANIHDPAAGLADCLIRFIAQFQVTAKLVVPILQHPMEYGAQTPLWGLLVAHQCGHSRQWVEFDLNLMQQVSAQISLALTQTRWAHYLHEAVEARTAQLQATNHHLHQGLCEYQTRERVKDEWVSVVSHELRTPLASLHSALKILATGKLGSLSSAGQQMLSIADQSAERLMRLFNNVLDLQRFEAGHGSLNLQICEAAPLMEQAIMAMTAFAQQHQVTLVSHPLDVAIWADGDAVVQVLTNLLSNAIKFSPPGETVWLTLEVQRETEAGRSPSLPPSESGPATALFRVRDQGQGIPPDQLERIFDQFQQAHPVSRRKGGTGLGLAICRKIVAQHQGTIWAESSWGQGSTFSFTLPAVVPKAADLPKAED